MNPHKMILSLSILGIIVTAAAFLIALYSNSPIIAILAVIGNISVVLVAVISLIAIKDEE